MFKFYCKKHSIDEFTVSWILTYDKKLLKSLKLIDESRIIYSEVQDTRDEMGVFCLLRKTILKFYLIALQNIIWINWSAWILVYYRVDKSYFC